MAKAIVEKSSTARKRRRSEFCFLKRDGKVKIVDKVEHNHPDLILQLPEGPTAFPEFAVCGDDSVVERAKFKEDKCRLGEEARATPCRRSYRGRDEGRDSEPDGSFAGQVERVVSTCRRQQS